jgi:hypothetical protein
MCLSLLEQREILRKPLDDCKVLQKPTCSEVAIQTDVNNDNQIIDSTTTKGIQDEGDNFHVYGHHLQQKIISQKIAYDQSRDKIYQELVDAKNQVSLMTQLHDKMRMERDLALGEVNELRKLLSVSRGALACIQEPDHPIDILGKLHLYKTNESKADLKLQPVTFYEEIKSTASYTTNCIPKAAVQGKEKIDLHYNYSICDDLENVVMRTCEALVLKTRPNSVELHEQQQNEPKNVIPVSLGSEHIVRNQPENMVIQADIEQSSLSSDSMDVTYGSCEFEEESEVG